MNCPQQPSFDELIAQSLAHLQQVHQYNTDLGISDCREFRSSYQSPKFGSESIDEFLAHYRPEEASISEFIACLQDSYSTTVHSEYDPWIENMSSKSLDSAADLEGSDSGAETEIAKTNTSPCSDGIDGPRYSLKRSATDHLNRIERAPVCRRVRRNMTAQERAERRRNQNREAQRRFRERHMFYSSRDVSGRAAKK
jgi:hypothetical protein